MSRYALNADQNSTAAVKAQLRVLHHKPKFHGPSALCLCTDYAQGGIQCCVKSVLPSPETVGFYKTVCTVTVLIHQSRIVDIILNTLLDIHELFCIPVVTSVSVPREYILSEF